MDEYKTKKVKEKLITSNKINHDQKQNISKSESVTIRISKEVREKIRVLSKDGYKNESQVIRQLIENGLDLSPKYVATSSPFAVDKVNHISGNTNKTWLGHENPISKIIFAMSYVLTIDTGNRTTEIIKLLQDYTTKSVNSSDKLRTRIKWEKYYLDLRNLIISHLSPSNTALVVIDTMILSFLSLLFPSPVFMASDLSVLLIDSFDYLLDFEKGKYNKK